MDECWVIDDSVEGYKSGLPLVTPWDGDWLGAAVIAPWEELMMIFAKVCTML